MTLATVADTFAQTTAMAENTLASAISGASMRLVSEQGQAFLVLTVTTASAEAAAELAITAADGALEMALASATATSVTIVAAAESAHGVSITDAGLSLAATGYGAVQGFWRGLECCQSVRRGDWGGGLKRDRHDRLGRDNGRQHLGPQSEPSERRGHQSESRRPAWPSRQPMLKRRWQPMAGRCWPTSPTRGQSLALMRSS